MHYRFVSIRSLPFVIIPLLTALVAVQARNATTPYFLLNYDPDYAYLFNSVNIVGFLSPAYVDHPGTPVQLLGALVIKLLHPFENSVEIFKAVIQDPEAYLFSISNMLITLNVLALFAAGVIFYEKTNRMELGLLVQLSPLLFPITVISFGRVTPEPLLLCVSTILTCLLGLTLNSNQETNDPKLTKAFGWVSGLGIATKLTFLPVIFLPIALFRSKPTIKLYVLHLFGGAFVFTSVFLLYPKLYYSFLRWIFNLFMGSGIYGQGERTVIDPQKFLSDMAGVALAQPLYLLIIALAILAYLVNSRGLRELHKKSCLLLGLIVIHLLALCIVAKHPQSMRYLVPTFGLSGVTLVIAVLALEPIYRRLKSGKWLVQSFAVVASIAGCAFLANQTFSTIDELRTREKKHKTETVKRNMLIEENYAHCIRVHQDSATQTFGLFFGLQWSRPSDSTSKVLGIMPLGKTSFSYDPNRKVIFTLGGDKLRIDDIRKESPCIIKLTGAGSLEVL